MIHASTRTPCLSLALNISQFELAYYHKPQSQSLRVTLIVDLITKKIEICSIQFYLLLPHLNDKFLFEIFKFYFSISFSLDLDLDFDFDNQSI